MIRRLSLLGTIFIFTLQISRAQDIQTSLMEEVSYVFVEKLIAVAKENYPKVKANNSRIAMAEANITGAKLAWFSPLSLSYVYSPANTLNITNPTFFSGYQIGFSLNLGTLLQTPINVKRAKEELNLEIYNRDEYNLSLITEVKTRYFSYLQALKNLKLVSQSYQDARNLLSSIKYRFEKGEITFQDYNTASIAYANSGQLKNSSEADILKTKAALEELLGIRLEEVR